MTTTYGEPVNPSIKVSDFEGAKTFLTKVDAYVLLRIRTSNPDQDIWLRMGRRDFIGFAAYIGEDAKQLGTDH